MELPPENQPAARSIAITLLYVLGFVAASFVIFLLPPPYSTIGLLVVVLGSLAWGVLRRAQIPTVRIRLPQIVVPIWLRARVVAHRDLLAAGFALLGFGLTIAAALDLRTLSAMALLGSGSVKMIFGALALGAAVRLSTRLPPLGVPLDVSFGTLRRSGWLFAAVGALLLAFVAEISAQIFHIPLLANVSSQLQIALFTAGVLLVGYGFGYGFSGAPSLDPRALKINWSVALPLAAIIALALFLRVWNGEDAQRYLLDELHYSDGVIAVEGRPDLPILTPMSGESPFTWIFPIWETTAVQFLGHNFVGFRFVSAIIGTLTVLAAFGLARELFDSQATALLAALVLATFPPHLHFSRTGIIPIADPLFGTMALFFFVRALRRNRPVDWALAGVSLGLTQYFYEGGRLLFPLLLASVVILLALRGRLRGKGRGLLLLLVTAVVIGAPFYYTLLGTHSPIFGRYDDAGLGASYLSNLAADGITVNKVSLAIQHLLSGFMIYAPHADMSVYYGGQQALVLDYLLPFFLLGCFYLLWRYPAPAFVIPLWIVATALGNGLLRDTVNAARYYVVLPALAIAIAAGVRYLWAFFVPEQPRSASAGVAPARPVWRWAIPVLACGTIAVAQVNYYFNEHLPFFNVQVRDSKPYRDGIDAALRAAALPANTRIYLVGKPAHDQNVPRDWLGFLIRDGAPGRNLPLVSVPPDTISPKYLLDLPHDANYAFFVDPSDVNVIAQIERYFPNTLPAQYSNSDVPAHKEYVLFFVPSGTMPFRQPPKHG